MFFNGQWYCIFSVMNAEKENAGSSRGNNSRRGVSAPVRVMVMTKGIVNFVQRKKA